MSYQKLFNNYFSTYGSQTGGAPATAPSTTTQPSNVFNLTVAKLRPRGAYSRHRPLQAGQEFNLSTANNNTGSVPQIAAQQPGVVPQIENKTKLEKECEETLVRIAQKYGQRVDPEALKGKYDELKKIEQKCKNTKVFDQLMKEMERRMTMGVMNVGTQLLNK